LPQSFFPTYHLPSTTYHLAPATCSSPPTTYDIPPATYELPSFQQHSRFQRVTTFVFYNIPGLRRVAESRSFVFIDIPESSGHFLKLLLLSLSLWRRHSVQGCCAGDESRQPELPSKQPAVGSRQWAVGSRWKADALHSDSWLQNPETCPSPPTTYRLPPTVFTIPPLQPLFRLLAPEC